MTGNGKNTTYKNGDDWAYFGGITIHLPAKIWATLGPKLLTHQLKSWSRAPKGPALGHQDKPLEKGEHKIQLYSMGTPPLGLVTVA